MFNVHFLQFRQNQLIQWHEIQIIVYIACNRHVYQYQLSQSICVFVLYASRMCLIYTVKNDKFDSVVYV